jgi:hypothetical protein
MGSAANTKRNEQRIKTEKQNFGLSELLNNFKNQSNKAAPGYFPGAENIKKGDIAFAWVPKKARLNPDYYDQDFLHAYLGNAMASGNAITANQAMNDIMSKQFYDQEQWISGRNFDHSQHILKVLSDAKNALYQGDTDYLANFQKDHPNFSLDPRQYNQDFGINPSSFKQAYLQRLRNHPMSHEDAANYMKYHVQPLIDHYSKLRAGYRQTAKIIEGAVSAFESKRADYMKSRGMDATPATYQPPVVSEHDQQIMDEAGKFAAPKTPQDLKAARRNARKLLGVRSLPTVKQMLMMKVQDGTLDPNNIDAVGQWKQKFENPNDPDTRSYYVAWAHQFNKDFDVKKSGLDYINKPLTDYQTHQAEVQAQEKAASEKYDETHTDNALDWISDEFKMGQKLHPFAADPQIGPGGTVSAPGGDVTTGDILQATMDTLGRPMYAVAGMAHAVYSMDKNPNHNWAQRTGWNDPLRVLDPVSWITGKSWMDSVDEMVHNPVGAAKAVGSAGYDQLLRGTHLPGLHDHVVPMTWERIIADNAAMDPDHNVYDSSWYQHVAGFAGDVAFDPLSYVGVGVVNDLAKLPVQFAKSFTREGMADIPLMRYVSGLTKRSASPVAEKVWRVQTFVDPTSVHYLGQNFDPITGELTHAAYGDMPFGNVMTAGSAGVKVNYDLGSGAVLSRGINREILNGIDAFKTKISQNSNDFATAHLNDVVSSSVPDTSIFVPELRVNKLVQEVGADTYWYGQGLKELARYRGHSGVHFGTDPLGQDALKAQQAIEELDRTADYHGVTPDSSEYDRHYDAIDKAIDDPASDTYRYAKVGDYLDELAKHDNPLDVMRSHARELASKPHTASEYRIAGSGSSVLFKDMRAAFAKAMGFEAKDFPLTDHEIMQSIIDGPRLAALESPMHGKVLDGLYRRRNVAKRGMKNAEPHSDLYKLHQANYEHAIATINHVTNSAVLRHMQDSITFARNGELYRDASLASKYQEDIARIAEIRQGLKASKTHIVDEGGAPVVKSDRTKRKLVTEYKKDKTGKFILDPAGNKIPSGHHWEATDEPLDSVHDPRAARSESRIAQDENSNSTWDDLNNLDTEDTDVHDLIAQIDNLGFDRKTALAQASKLLSRRLNELSITKDGKIVGLTKQEAYELHDELAGTALVKSNGQIDESKLRQVLFFDKEAKGKVGYRKPPKSSPDYVRLNSALNKIRGAIQAKYAIRYNELYEDAIKAAKAGTPVEHTVMGRNETRFLERNPHERDKMGSLRSARGQGIKASDGYGNSAWGKMFPDGFASPNDLIQHALTSEDDFYDALYSAGAPFKYKGPGKTRIPINGKAPKVDEPASLRKWASKQFQGDREATDAYMRKVAHEAYKGLLGDLKPEELKRIGQTYKEMESAGAHDLADEVAVGTAARRGEDAIGIRTLFHEAWNRTLRSRADKFKENLEKARAADKYEASRGGTKSKTNAGTLLDEGTKVRIAQQAEKESMDSILKQVVESQKVERNFGNERMTINEYSRAVEKQVRAEFNAKARDIKIELAESPTVERRAELTEMMSHLDVVRKNAIKAIEKARQEAHATNKLMRERYAEEILLQSATMPTRVSRTAVQLRVAGLRKNVQTFDSMVQGANLAQIHLPDTVYNRFARNFIRPSKQLEASEAKTYWAMWSSKTPFIIKAHLARLNKRMGRISTENRTSMMDALRNGREYKGGQSGLRQGVADEINEIVNIFNGKHDFYRFRTLTGETSVLAPKDINRFLSDDFRLDTKMLAELKKDRLLEAKIAKAEGVDLPTDYTLDDILSAVIGPKAHELTDPYRFSWVMRLAADQARQTKALHHLLGETFGVRRDGKLVWNPETEQNEFRVNKNDRAKVIEMLKTKGWETIPELDNVHYFPQEAVRDVRTMLDLMQPGSQTNNLFLKSVDKFLGFWKPFTTIYNPGYYARNGIGEIMASWLAGISHPKYYSWSKKIVKYMTDDQHDLAELVDRWSVLGNTIHPDVVDGSDVLFKSTPARSCSTANKARSMQRNAREPQDHVVTIERALKAYVDHGLKSTFANTDLERGARSIAEAQDRGPIRAALGHANEKIHDVGENFEDYLRIAHFVGRLEKNMNKGMRFEHAAEHAAGEVRKYHFDYADFSKFEQAVMLRIFPFYKWTRRGAPLMLQHMFMTPGKITAIPKAMNTLSGLGFNPVGMFNDDPVFSTQDVHEDTNGFLPNYSGIAPAFVQDLWAYQMGPSVDDEYANYMRIATPQMDGLNAMFNPPNAAQTLLNPLLKMPAELAMNHPIGQPDNQIVGGDYNQMNGVNPVESLINYGARNLSPDLGFLSKLSMHGDLPNGLNMADDHGYRDSKGYSKAADIASFLTGLGFYQGMPKDKPEPDKNSTSDPSAAVGFQGSQELPKFSGASAAQGSSYGADAAQSLRDWLIGDTGSSSDSSGYSKSGYSKHGSGWHNFFKNYKHYKHYKHYSHHSGSSFSGGSSASSSDLLALLEALKKQVDQGKVIDG